MFQACSKMVSEGFEDTPITCAEPIDMVCAIRAAAQIAVAINMTSNNARRTRSRRESDARSSKDIGSQRNCSYFRWVGSGPKNIAFNLSRPMTRASSPVTQYIRIRTPSRIWIAQKCGQTISDNNF